MTRDALSGNNDDINFVKTMTMTITVAVSSSSSSSSSSNRFTFFAVLKRACVISEWVREGESERERERERECPVASPLRLCATVHLVLWNCYTHYLSTSLSLLHPLPLYSAATISRERRTIIANQCPVLSVEVCTTKNIWNVHDSKK